MSLKRIQLEFNNIRTRTSTTSNNEWIQNHQRPRSPNRASNTFTFGIPFEQKGVAYNNTFSQLKSLYNHLSVLFSTKCH